jgi:hypothetical protein
VLHFLDSTDYPSSRALVEIISSGSPSTDNEEAFSSIETAGKSLSSIFEELIQIHSSTASPASSGSGSASESSEEEDYEMEFNSPMNEIDDAQRLRRIALDLSQIRQVL